MAAPQAQPLGGVFDAWFADGPEPEVSSYLGFAVRCVVAQNIPPRDPQFTYMMELGRGIAVDVFDQRAYTSTDPRPQIVFPERYLTVHEQQYLLPALGRVPGHEIIERVDILTSSPLIVGNVTGASSCRVLTSEDYFHAQRSAAWFPGLGL